VGFLGLHSLIRAFPFPPMGIAQWLVHVLPGRLETWAIETFGPLASKLLTTAVTLAWIGLIALGFAHVHVSPRRMPLDESRRSFLRSLGLLGAGLALGGFAVLRSLPRVASRVGGALVSLGRVRRAQVPPSSPADQRIAATAGITPALTSNANFYVVDQSLVQPDIDERTWRLNIHGWVDHPYALSYEELISLPAVEQFVTLECISNHVGGQLISTAVWRGVPIAALLQRANVRPSAVEIITRGEGGYSTNLPLTRVQKPDALVVYGMNGRALPRAHGFPARVLVPGLYGMKNCKWLTGIEVSNKPALGYWEVRGWSDQAIVRTTSRIDTPISGSKVPRGSTLAGIAFAGDRGISRVEVSLDGGHAWQPASIARALAETTWVQWSRVLAPDVTGGLNILVRAVDGSGVTQSPEYLPPHPSGASGYHGITITVT
jgi:DMSO/TMAO reductase YedYZ molybdopterin-dependent catalytic subunit